MNNIKESFSIRDLENLSGIKAHTIRIWEKRYNLLHPERTDTNIRTYSTSSLQKLLNIALLYNNGYKISKIAKIPEKDIPEKVNEIHRNTNGENQIINTIKLAMLNYDQAQFLRTYDTLLSKKSFREVFHSIFIPLLTELGLLWQTDTITPAQEHFITGLIKQKIITNTEKIQTIDPVRKDRVFVLFLPENEIHDIGLLYINYELVSKGFRTIYLGPTVPLQNLSSLMGIFENATFVSYFTIMPEPNKIKNYVDDFITQAKPYNISGFWIFGRQAEHLKGEDIPKTVKVFTSIKEAVDEL